MLAEVGGAIGGGVVGLFAGALLVFPISMACALIGILAKIYWEVLTGRRKLPSMSSQTKAHRRMMFKLMAVIFMVTAALWASLYFAGPDAVRSRLLLAVAPLLGTFFIGLLILIVAYRRHPAQEESNKDE
jgi:Na+/proline symporter